MPKIFTPLDPVLISFNALKFAFSPGDKFVGFFNRSKPLEIQAALPPTSKFIRPPAKATFLLHPLPPNAAILDNMFFVWGFCFVNSLTFVFWALFNLIGVRFRSSIKGLATPLGFLPICATISGPKDL